MKLFKTAAIAALTVSCAITFGAPAAQSATLLDFLRGNKSSDTEKSARKNNNTLFGRSNDNFGASLDDDLGGFPDSPKSNRPLPKVSAPKYFTYKADGLKLIAVAKFAPKMETAAADPVQTDPSQTGSIQNVNIIPEMDFSNNPRAFMMDVHAKATADVAAAIEKFYAAHDGLLWVDANGVTQKARDAMAALAEVGNVGLDAADYRVTDPTDTFVAVDATTKQRQLMQFEVELTAAMLSYIQDTQRGRIDPNRIAEYYDFKRKSVNLEGALRVASMSPDIKSYLESRSPSNPQFDALKMELAKLRTEQGGEEARVEIAPGTLLKPGQANDQVPNVIAAIRQHGSDKLKLEHSVTLASYQGTPDYTPELVDVVKAFQTEKGLKGDGVVGKGTIRLLMGGDTASSKIEKVIVAMEQMRWLPNNLGPRYVFINQPAFKVSYHNNNKEEFEMGVVVGSPGHQTFFFEDEIELVEFNPYWGVPRSIIVNEMLPKLREDPSYLDRLGYETSIGGQTMSSTEVDWESTSSVDVRQPPGRGNALGQLKIMFPNSHAIYMHDTPQKSFFKRDMRALSHGCVRLSDPKKMAAAVMGMTIEQIDAEIATGQNHQAKVPERFPVYIAYFTAYPNKDGVVEYFDDVYNRDAYMDKAFAATKKAREVAS
ncbi:MAG: Peptidoglycan-binding domain 1 protein [Rhizobium sp.]|nr:Peptidoglycan-binding domain 1 protein [Rhizobium sp.]